MCTCWWTRQSAYHEIIGQRKRNRLLDLDRLGWRLATDDLGAVQKNLEASLSEVWAREQAQRETCWTESLVVGSIQLVKRMQQLMVSGQETEIVEGPDGVCALRETETPYGQEKGPKNSP